MKKPKNYKMETRKLEAINPNLHKPYKSGNINFGN